jgi:hypothetical protein
VSRRESRAAAERAGRATSATVVTYSADPLLVRGRGLQFPQRLSFERWLRVGFHLSSMTTTLAWCLGDWLVYGESHFTGRYRQAIEQTSLDYQTLRNYAWVTRRFTPARRRDGLSFGHHAEVAALTESEQEYWLRKSEELSWSRNRLRSEVRKSVAERRMGGRAQPGPAVHLGTSDDGPSVGSGSSILTLEVSVSPEYLAVCETAARVCGLSLEQWVRRALEQVARRALSQGSVARG